MLLYAFNELGLQLLSQAFLLSALRSRCGDRIDGVSGGTLQNLRTPIWYEI